MQHEEAHTDLDRPVIEQGFPLSHYKSTRLSQLLPTLGMLLSQDELTLAQLRQLDPCRADILPNRSRHSRELTLVGTSPIE